MSDSLMEYIDRVPWKALKWRVGSKFARNIYAQLGDEPSKLDPYVGVVETQFIARHIVEMHNNTLSP